MPEIIKNKKVKIKKSKPQKPVIVYLLASLKGFVVSFAGLTLTCFLLMNNGSFNVFTKIIIYVIIGAGAMLSGFIANKKLRGRGYINGLLSAVIYLALYIVTALLLMHFKVNTNILILVPVAVLSGISGGIISANS